VIHPLAGASGSVPFALQKQIGPLIAQEAACYITKRKLAISNFRSQIPDSNIEL